MTTTTSSGQPAGATTSVPDIPYLKFGEAVTLTNCDREPIHIPGHAQAHGAVVALDPGADDLIVLQASANLEAFCGLRAEEALGLPASALFNDDQGEILRSALASGRLEANPLYLFTGAVHGPNIFHVTAHTFGGVLTIELEHVEETGKAADLTFPRAEPQALLKQALTRLRATTTLADYGHAVCESVQELSGFDRVMLYKFHDDGHGEVMAEVVGESDTREPYLGLHYPESDIPKQARALYLLNGIRLMPDAQYEPAPILPTLNPLTGRPLDMTHCVLRGYSRMYTEYLTNMGARASMSLAIIQDGILWGLVACHHQTYRWIPYDVRTACEFLADVVSLQIGEKESQGDSGYKERMRDAHQHLVENMARHGEILNGLTQDPVNILSLIESGGGAVVVDDECRLLGNTPPEDEVRGVIRWINETQGTGEDLWVSDALPAIYGPAEPRKDRAAGLLALRVTKAPPPGNWVLWFRPEVVQTVNWGGNPNKPYQTGPMGDRLTPRASFDLWQETVRGKSLPWKPVEIEAARRLRNAVAEVIVRRAEELSRLNIELARSNVELDSFAYVASHDLKEPLRGINNYVRFFQEDHGEELPEEARAKLDTLSRLTRRMDSLLDSLLHYSRVGRQDMALDKVDLNQVLEEAIESLQFRLRETGTAVRVPRPLPGPIVCDPVQIGEVFTNLISNGAKYNDNAPGERWVEVGWIDPEREENSAVPPTVTVPVYYVRDNGIGIAEKHQDVVFRIFKRLHGRGEYSGGTGAGLTIAQKIVERHGGQIWLESAVGGGTTFYFTLSSAGKGEIVS